MGSHDWAGNAPKDRLGPAPGRLRVLVGRSAAIVLILGALTWICVSLLFNPPPRGPDPSETFPLEVLESSPAAGNALNPETSELGTARSAGPSGEPDKATDRPGATPSPGIGAESGGATAVIHLIGAVKSPGVYWLPVGSRVLDAVNKAGGLANDASAEAINLAAEIRDGEQIRIPRRGEPAQAKLADRPPDPEGGVGSGQVAPSGGLNVNMASQDQLEQLPGIGPTLAGRIIEFRTANGPLANISELDAVSGIGPALLGNLRELVVFE